MMVVVELGLGQQSVSHFCLPEILFCVLDFEVFFSKQLIESLLNIHIQIIFKLYQCYHNLEQPTGSKQNPISGLPLRGYLNSG